MAKRRLGDSSRQRTCSFISIYPAVFGENRIVQLHQPPFPCSLRLWLFPKLINPELIIPKTEYKKCFPQWEDRRKRSQLQKGSTLKRTLLPFPKINSASCYITRSDSFQTDLIIKKYDTEGMWIKYVDDRLHISNNINNKILKKIMQIELNKLQ